MCVVGSRDAGPKRPPSAHFLSLEKSLLSLGEGLTSAPGLQRVPPKSRPPTPFKFCADGTESSFFLRGESSWQRS